MADHNHPDQSHPSRLAARNLTVGYRRTAVLSDVELGIPNGKITALIGANGSGKSTLLRSLGQALAPLSGSVLLDGKAIAASPRKAVARLLALLPQSPLAPDGITVRELCEFGRHPHRGVFARSSDEDRRAVARALAAAELEALAERPIDELSGGQRQRAWIAMALAQQTPIMLLDEPTTYLDIAHQIDVLGLLTELNRTEGRTIAMVLHDLNQAAQHAHHIVAVAGGRIHAQGPSHELLTPALIQAVFGVSAVVVTHPVAGTPLCLPLATERTTGRTG